MAFHVACPITCRRICFCPLGFAPELQNGRAKNEFLDGVHKVEDFLKDPWGIRVNKDGKGTTVQVWVPKVAPPSPPVLQPVGVVGEAFSGADGVDEMTAAMSAQTKRIALQRKAAAAMIAAEDYARRFESGSLVDASGNLVEEEQGQSNINVMCRICFFGENESSERARKMLSCKSCGKKYHRSCLKSWAQHRDLFHWSSWTCPSCRACEVCRRTGDPNKFMFCKRCDGAYHCYCQHPPHKNVSSGPYLCPKHTRCHSCESNVPGNGQSVRWFLGYTFCDACGRLFVKGNYCPVCLKVYRDSESTPMVCCDTCQRWVHCQCDSISDEKYLQFQMDGNLQYKCTACRGECYQVKNLDDAVQEIWRRKDDADRDLIVNLRAAAGLPIQEEIFSISPYSDDEENGPSVIKNEFGRSIKLSLKGLGDNKVPKKSKDYGKKSSNKKYSKEKVTQIPVADQSELEGHNDVQQYGSGEGNDKNGGLQPQNNKGTYSSPVAGSLGHHEGMCSINQPGVLKHKFVDEVMVSDEERTSKVVQIKANKTPGSETGEDAGKHASKSKTTKGKKLVINLGARKINVANSPKSDASSCQREQDLVTSNGDKVDNSSQSTGPKAVETEKSLPSYGKVRFGSSDTNSAFGRTNTASGSEVGTPDGPRVFSRKRNVEGSTPTVGSLSDVSTVREEKVASGKQHESGSHICNDGHDDSSQTPLPQSLPRDSKPLLKFKFKKPTLENQASSHEEERSLVKGQRSKRKRPSPLMEKIYFNEVEDMARSRQDNLLDEIMDANWILKKLGKDAIGKRVEVQHPSDKSWQKGVVSDMIDGTSTLSVEVTLDDNRVKTLELGKQGIRLVPLKQKRSKS
ncbi:uncharacterized protein LOC111461058 [Cucurbita moschata]|uniref:Uncharacterized protein LOC111461058 n=1 Tax=Cucurbita moschata TaxID=3662 RepID=A0A6J1H754_CUCMO|nr:uncharacterized protein LOC111461058 [Cucurbita moschata]